MSKIILPASLIMLLLLSLTMVSAITGSLGNGRAVLYPKLGADGITIDRTILVSNVNNVSINIKMEADSNFTIANVIDKTFTLKPGEQKNARLQLIIKKTGFYDGKINVFFTPASGNGAGVALSSEFVIYATAGNNTDNTINNGNSTGNTTKPIKISTGMIVVISSTIVLLILLIILLLLSRKNKTKKRSVRSS